MSKLVKNAASWIVRGGRKGDILEKAYSGTDKASSVIIFAPQDENLAKWLHQNLKQDNREVWIDLDKSPPVNILTFFDIFLLNLVSALEC
jgi:hypothetical protein